MLSDVEQFIVDVFGWPGRVRLNTFDLTAIKEVYVEDVYRAKEYMEKARVLDLGANVGVFSVWAIQHGASKVIAVECCPENFSLLQKNTEASAAIFCVHAAVGPEDGTCKSIYLGDKDAHKSYVFLDGPGDVEMRTLDTIVGEQTFDFVKIDIEGMEWEIFKTVKKETMKKMLHIGIEFHGTDCPGSSEQPPGAFGELMEKLSETHCIHTLGTASRGGMIYADAF